MRSIGPQGRQLGSASDGARPAAEGDSATHSLRDGRSLFGEAHPVGVDLATPTTDSLRRLRSWRENNDDFRCLSACRGTSRNRWANLSCFDFFGQIE